MSISIDCSLYKQSAYSAYAIGLIDIMKHELHKNEGHSQTLELLFDLTNSPELANTEALKDQIRDFQFKQMNQSLLEHLVKALQRSAFEKKHIQLLRYGGLGSIHKIFTQPRSTHTEQKKHPKTSTQVSGYEMLYNQTAQEYITNGSSSSQSNLPNYQALLNEVNEIHNQSQVSIDDFAIFQTFSSLCWALLNNPKQIPLDNELASSKNIIEGINNTLIPRINRLRHWFNIDSSFVEKYQPLQADPNFFNTEITRYIDQQILDLFMKDVYCESSTHLKAINPNSVILSALKNNEGNLEDLKTLSHHLSINLSCSNTENTPSPNKFLGSPTITISNPKTNHWLVQLTSTRKNISKFDAYYSDTILNKNEIKAIFSAYRNKKLGFFVNHHDACAKNIIRLCEQEEVEVGELVDQIKSYLLNKSISWKHNSHFKDAAQYICKRANYYNGFSSEHTEPLSRNSSHQSSR